MKRWPDEKIINLLGIDKPIIQAPMAGADTPELAASVSAAGGLGSLACALLTPEQIRRAWSAMRAMTDKPLNLNFFSHRQPADSPAQQEAWLARLMPYYTAFGLDPTAAGPAPARAPFDESFCEVVEELKPEVVSFHFGLPPPALLDRVKKTGAAVLSSATTVAEAKWLADNGCDAVIAQGAEAGGHRGMFLNRDVSAQVGTIALVPQVVDAVSLPVIAAGGIADARGIRAALALGASAAQLGTAYLFCPEAGISPLYRQALKSAKDDATALTNLFSGRPARGMINRFIREAGPFSPEAPDFPYAARLVAPLRRHSEAIGNIDFMQLWAGQSAALAREMPAHRLTETLAEDVLKML